MLHEYSTIEGVQEDVIDILLNLKKVAMRMHNRTEATADPEKEGPGSGLSRATSRWTTISRSSTRTS